MPKNNNNIKVVILAGGFGTRLGEYTQHIPKPMVNINRIPLLIYILKIFLNNNFKNFYIAGGYKFKYLVNYFKKFKINNKNFTHKIQKDMCNIKIINTGLKTMTGGRLKRLKKYISEDELFMFTYGDGIADINLKKLYEEHLKSKKITTITAVHPPARFGELKLKKNIVTNFKEKPQVASGWINGGFFISYGKIFNYIKNDFTILEKEPLEKLSEKRQLNAYKHESFWKCVDTKRDIIELSKILKKKSFFKK